MYRKYEFLIIRKKKKRRNDRQTTANVSFHAVNIELIAGDENSLLITGQKFQRKQELNDETELNQNKSR